MLVRLSTVYVVDFRQTTSKDVNKFGKPLSALNNSNIYQQNHASKSEFRKTHPGKLIKIGKYKLFRILVDF